MLNPANILEIAFLLLVSFLVGATVGSLTRFLTLRIGRPAVAATAAPPAVAAVPPTEAAPALVAAPVIEPIAKSAPPVAPAEVAAPDFTEVVEALVAKPAPAFMSDVRMPSVATLPALEAGKPALAMAPARVAGKTTSGIEIASPVITEMHAPENLSHGLISAEVIPFPTERAAPVAEAVEVDTAGITPTADLPKVAAGAMGPEPAVEAEAPMPSPALVEEGSPVAVPEPVADERSEVQPLAGLDAARDLAPESAKPERERKPEAEPEPETVPGTMAERGLEAAAEPAPMSDAGEPSEIVVADLAHDAIADGQSVPEAPSVASAPEVAGELIVAVAAGPVAQAAPELVAAAELVTAAAPGLAPEPVAETVLEPAVPIAPVAAIPAAVSSEEDEAAAMRAIEGNWTPRRATAATARKLVVPEGVDADQAVQAASAAVAAAVEAVNAVVAEALSPATNDLPGRPEALDGPRQGLKDNLTNVIGILPIIETALNNAGVYHFDQIADLSDDNVEWLEAHLGIGGRIGREHWREQARELAIVSERARKVAAKK